MSPIKRPIEHFCRKCNFPFDNKPDRLWHERRCMDQVLLENPEAPENTDSPSYRSLLVAASKRDAVYLKYVNRKDPGIPDRLWLGMFKTRPPKKKKLDQLEYEDIPDLNPGGS